MRLNPVVGGGGSNLFGADLFKPINGVATAK
jgi:hypothetical protein